MSGGIEAAGDIATGMLVGRAVEPAAGEDGGHGGGVCLNCGTALIGDFCHACGQNGHVHKTLASIGHDLLHGVFHFEGKVWRTLPMLVARPGQLTRRYIDGERARFVSPLAMFLFFVFVMFASFHSIGGEDVELNPEKAIATAGDLKPQIDRVQAKLAQIEKDRAAAVAKGQDTDQIDEQRDDLRDSLRGMQKAQDGLASGKKKVLSDPHTGWAALDKGIKKANANPDLALYKLQGSAYKYSWALIPISVPFVALLFLWRRRFKSYDHAIFVTYSLAFMMLLATAVSLLVAVGAAPWTYEYLLTFGPPVHIFFQLRGAYQLRWYSALWRTFALLIFASITLILFVMFLLGLGLME